MKLHWNVSTRAFPVKVSLAFKDRAFIYGTAFVFIIAILSLALTLQGWKSRIPAFDLLTYIYDAHQFLEKGVLPQRGDTGSYGSYSTPGTTWLMLPGIILSSDVRFYEYVGAALLHVSTMLGLFLLARDYVGNWCATLAVLLYGLSEHAIFFAGSLWPIARPDFFIWFVYFTGHWVVRKDARYLAAAFAVWALGMNVDMAMLPAFFILPAAWFYYRPPVRLSPLLCAGAIVLFAWIPYLRFEAGRGFVDLRSQLLQQHIFPANYRETWCDPKIPLQNFSEPSTIAASNPNQALPQKSSAIATSLTSLLSFLSSAKEKALYNFQPVAPIPWIDILLLLLTLAGLLILSLPGSSNNRAGNASQPLLWRQWPIFIATGMTLVGLCLSLFILFLNKEGAQLGAKILLIYKLRKILVLSGVALLAGIFIANIANRILVRLSIPIQTSEQVEQRRFLLISLLIPWFLLMILAEPGKPERFWWLWPLQSLFLAAFFTNVLPRFRVPKEFIWAAQVVVVLIIAANSFLLSRVDSWVRTGWAGQDADEIQVVDTIAHQVKAEGRDRAAIGYQTFIYPFMAEYNITNPVYKVGAEFDLLLLYRHGIVNTNQCAEGVAAGDEYRVVETRPKPPTWSPKDYFATPMDDRFSLKKQLGFYQVFQRD